jgi:hypothetical protein
MRYTKSQQKYLGHGGFVLTDKFLSESAGMSNRPDLMSYVVTEAPKLKYPYSIIL